MLRFTRTSWIILTLLTIFLLTGCGLSLADDIEPPPNYKPPTPVSDQPVGTSTEFPLVPPDPAQGAQIYAEKCLPCHGESGMGDGPQAANLSNPVAPLGSPELARASKPVDWFNMVTVGNLERFMPGFASLNDRQRWDVVAYAYTLSTSADELEQGKALYNENCATCHGETGQGDGEQSASLPVEPANWGDQERLAALSAEDMTGVMAGEKEGHPSFADQMDEEQRYAVAAYVRSLSFSGVGDESKEAQSGEEQPAEGSTDPSGDSGSSDSQDEVVVPEEIIFTGQVVNATPGGAIPAGMKVVITAYDSMSPAFEVTGDVAEDGSYQVEGVEFNPNLVYLARVDANGLTYNSDIVHGRDVTGGKIDLPIEIYDTTTLWIRYRPTVYTSSLIFPSRAWSRL